MDTNLKSVARLPALLVALIVLGSLCSCGYIVRESVGSLRRLGFPAPQHLGQLAYVATYKYVDSDDCGTGARTSSWTVTSDGKARVRVERSNEHDLQIFDCNHNIVYTVYPKEHVYAKDKIVNIPDSSKSFYPAESHLFNYVQVASEYAIQEGPMVGSIVACIVEPEPPAFVGNEDMDGYKCRHYRSPPNAQVKAEAWYCPKTNCCIKYSERGAELTLVKYSTKVGANAFDLNGNREVSYIELHEMLDKSDH